MSSRGIMQTHEPIMTLRVPRDMPSRFDTSNFSSTPGMAGKPQVQTSGTMR